MQESFHLLKIIIHLLRGRAKKDYLRSGPRHAKPGTHFVLYLYVLDSRIKKFQKYYMTCFYFNLPPIPLSCNTSLLHTDFWLEKSRQ